MSEEIKRVEQIEQEANAPELSEQDLEKVAGGKSYLESRSNSANYAAAVPLPPTPPKPNV